MKSRQRGFTIVELLIVIVVIAILAAITIVAYNGIQQRARASEASAALSQAKKKLELYKVDNSSYPTTGNLSAAGVSDGDVSFQYTSDGNTYCITGTATNVSYKATDTTSPTAGGCAGHGQGGVAAITNLAINPSAGANINYWSNNIGYASVSRDSSNTCPGSPTTGSIKTTFNTSATVSTQLWDGTSTPLVPISSGEAITISACVKSSVAGRSVQLVDRWRNSSLGEISASGGSSISISTSWTRLNFTATAPASTVYSHISFYFVGQAGDSWWLDDVMVTKGSTVYAYADGNSPDWAWNGTANNSTSTGPPL